MGDPQAQTDDVRLAIEHDGGILGDPNGYRFATGKRNVDVTGCGAEMLRGRHEKKNFVV